MALFVISCGGNASAEGADTDATEMTEAAAHGEGKEYTSAYVCPMHCEGSGSEEAGKCPVCGMDYVALDTHTGDGHEH
ncbi:hypothetical protein CRP01_14080 [Flavilitoribacter nigricans DSM 23189 = NBRC 102662]|uniref:Heavy metal binding domain-containing protein n=2 Tax=Flavilitoribacter TaxID=2762562 RepID=A0A2D0NCC9_FLAN2|nr:hypothetical protein CRP01_14080 [Flavilitoribacter nigricans DSM 23189 = NBRC 102662]